MLAVPKNAQRRFAEAFRDCQVKVVGQDPLVAAEGRAIACPTDSFGMMSGGMDQRIRKACASQGFDLAGFTQMAVVRMFDGEIPVGSGFVVMTGPPTKYSHVVVAPVMRTPQAVKRTVNAYLAMRAVLLSVRAWNQSNEEHQVTELVLPPLMTAQGRMPLHRVAEQMRSAWDAVYFPRPDRSFTTVVSEDLAMRFV